MRSPNKNGNRAFTVLTVVVVLLAGAVGILGYDVASLCSSNSSLSNNLLSASVGIGNATLTLRAQVAADETLIGTLDSSRIQGYQNMVAFLKNQIGADEAMITSLQQLIPVYADTAKPAGASFCL